MAVLGFVPAGGNRVHVDVQRAGRGRVEGQALDPRLLPSLPERDRVALPLPRLRMASGLEPAPELPVVEEEHPVPRRRDDHRAAREMALDDAAVEGIGVAVEEGQDLGQIPRFLRVRRRVPSQQDVKGRLAGNLGHAAPPVAGRGDRLDTRDVRTLPAGDHDPQHGRATARRCQPDNITRAGARVAHSGRGTGTDDSLRAPARRRPARQRDAGGRGRREGARAFRRAPGGVPGPEAGADASRRDRRRGPRRGPPRARLSRALPGERSEAGPTASPPCAS